MPTLDSSIELTTKFIPYVDEMFATESKKELITNKDFNFDGSHVVELYKITTSEMHDYDRAGKNGGVSRYGPVAGLSAVTESFMLKRDRSFTFAIDKLDTDETAQQLQAGTALSRQIREVVIPEVDKYTYGVMCENAGNKPEAMEITADNIYTAILAGNKALDDAEVPETNRTLIVTPDIYTIMKQNSNIIMETDIGTEMRRKGVIGMLDGCNVVKVPANRLPDDFGFMICHPCATVAPTKLADYRIHNDPPGISGSLVEGRIVYDACVFENKAKAIYYQALKATT